MATEAFRTLGLEQASHGALLRAQAQLPTYQLLLQLREHRQRQAEARERATLDTAVAECQRLALALQQAQAQRQTALSLRNRAWQGDFAGALGESLEATELARRSAEVQTQRAVRQLALGQEKAERQLAAWRTAWLALRRTQERGRSITEVRSELRQFLRAEDQAHADDEGPSS
jgi:hypothetical protein